jgi:hypothetical protein
MLQDGDGLSFAVEALAEFWIGGEVRGEDFNGDGVVEAGVFRAIDLAHATCADGRDNFVRT